MFGNFSLFKTPSRDRTPSLPLLSLFLSFIFFPTSFRRVGLLFWVPDGLTEVACSGRMDNSLPRVAVVLSQVDFTSLYHDSTFSNLREF